jgi:hypothetical protein
MEKQTSVNEAQIREIHKRLQNPKTPEDAWGKRPEKSKSDEERSADEDKIPSSVRDKDKPPKPRII